MTFHLSSAKSEYFKPNKISNKTVSRNSCHFSIMSTIVALFPLQKGSCPAKRPIRVERNKVGQDFRLFLVLDGQFNWPKVYFKATHIEGNIPHGENFLRLEKLIESCGFVALKTKL